MSLSSAEKLAHSTVRIECELDNGGTSTGTGFFYKFNDQGDSHVPAIVTNKHVVEGASRGRFLLTRKNEKEEPQVGSFKAFELMSFGASWIHHPDPEIDLCALPIAPLLHQAAASGETFFYTHLDKSLLPSDEDIEDMVGLENVTMVGYPNGIWDRANNLPIFRRGTLATDYKRDWNGKEEFLIDAACFPGSSGSPVLLFDTTGYQTRKAIFMGAPRIKLLGILYAGPQYTVEGEVKVVNVPTQQKPISLSSIPNNLGIIIKSKKLDELDSLFK